VASPEAFFGAVGGERVIHPQGQADFPGWQLVPIRQTSAMDFVARKTGQDHAEHNGRPPQPTHFPAADSADREQEQRPPSKSGTGTVPPISPAAKPAIRGSASQSSGARNPRLRVMLHVTSVARDFFRERTVPGRRCSGDPRRARSTVLSVQRATERSCARGGRRDICDGISLLLTCFL